MQKLFRVKDSDLELSMTEVQGELVGTPHDPSAVERMLYLHENGVDRLPHSSV